MPVFLYGKSGLRERNFIMHILRKVMVTLAAACIIVPLMQAKATKVNAIDTSSYSIHQGCTFDVDVVNDQGGFDHKECASSFSAAVTAMNKYGQDAVVRHSASKSPTKIVAMVNGIVISNPYRTGDSLSYYYEKSNFTGSSTYSQQYMQAKYNGTASYNTDGSGSVALTMNGFEGYIKLVNCDLVPIKYFTNHLPIILGDNNTSDKEYTIYPEMNKYVCGTDSAGNKELYFYSYWGWSNSVASPSQTNAYPNRQGVSLSAADWMQAGTTYYSYNGYDFYTDMAMTKKAGTYYDYYQFLPTRTKSNITGAELDSYLISKGYISKSRSALYGEGQTFVDAQNTYGVNALLVYAMAIQESGYGTSNFALNRNNLFGWNAVDSNPNGASYFDSIYQAVNEHMHTNLNGYLDVDDSRHFGMQIGNKGNGFNVKYASDAYWGINIAHYAYEIDKYTGFKDRYTYTVGVVSSSTDVWFNKTSTDNSHFYNIKNPGGSYYEKAYTITILGEANGKYKVQSSDHLINGNLTRASAYNGREYSNGKPYNWDSYVSWINKEYITTLYHGSPSDQVNVPDTDDSSSDSSGAGDSYLTDEDVAASATGELDRGVDKVTFDENSKTVTIEGVGYINGMDATGTVESTVYLVNTETGEKTAVSTENTNYDNQMTSYWYRYVNVGYKAVISLSEIGKGNYYLTLEVRNGDTVKEKPLLRTIQGRGYSVEGENNLTTRIFSNPLMNYRIEVSCETENPVLDEENSPASMTPSFGFDDISVDNGILTIKNGYSFFRNADVSESVHPKFTVYLIDESGEVKSYEASAKASTYDFSYLVNSKNDFSFASFDLSADLKDLASGTYRVYIRIETDQYSDIFEMYSNSKNSYSGESEGRTFTLNRTNTRLRYELTVN